MTRATIVWNPEFPDNTAEVNAMLAAVEQLGMKVEFVVNMKTVRALGLALAQSVPLRADEVIEEAIA